MVDLGVSRVSKHSGPDANRSIAPDDIAGPVVFLSSDMAKYITGASLLVDGGLFVNLQ